MTKKTTTILLASAVAGLMTLGLTAAAGTAHAEGDGVKCYGVNGCKGTGECGGKGHSCAGKNECKGQGFVKKPTAEECLAIQGGRLTAEAN